MNEIDLARLRQPFRVAANERYEKIALLNKPRLGDACLREQDQINIYIDVSLRSAFMLGYCTLFIGVITHQYECKTPN